MLTRLVCAVAGAMGAVALGAPGVAAADPLDVNAYPPVNPQDFAVMDGSWYAFAAPGGVTCVMDRQTGGYGCSGALPGAPGGANMVSGYAQGAAGFGSSDRPMYGAVEDAPVLPPHTRMSFQTVSCGTDGVSMSCLNSLNQSGFVVGPGGSFTF